MQTAIMRARFLAVERFQNVRGLYCWLYSAGTILYLNGKVPVRWYCTVGTLTGTLTVPIPNYIYMRDKYINGQCQQVV